MAEQKKQQTKKVKTERKPKVMAKDLQIATTKKNVVEFTKDILKDGYGVCTPVINGEPCPNLKFGYCGDADYEAASKLVEKVITATEGDVPKSMGYIMQAAKIAEAKISPDEQVTVNNVECIIDYKARTIYGMDCQEIANVKELSAGNKEAIKLLLIERAKAAIETHPDLYDEGYDDGYEDGYDDGVADTEEADIDPEELFKKLFN